MNRTIIWKYYLVPVIICAVLVVVVFWVCWLTPEKTVFLVRHAEKVYGNDPPLSVAGEDRAQELVHVLGDSGVNSIFVTDTLRTHQTAEPLAQQTGVTVTEISIGDIPKLVNQIRSTQSGEVVLAVGHSNTIDQIISGLGGDPISPITENEYDHLYVVIICQCRTTRVLHLRYGE